MSAASFAWLALVAVIVGAFVWGFVSEALATRRRRRAGQALRDAGFRNVHTARVADDVTVVSGTFVSFDRDGRVRPAGRKEPKS